MIQENGLQWHKILLRRRPRLALDMAALADLIRLYATVRPDLVHHIALKAVMIGTLAARITGVPAVVNAVTGLGYAFDRRRANLVGRCVAVGFDKLLRHPRVRYVFQNVEDRDLFTGRGWSSAEQAVLIRGSGVDPGIFFPSRQMRREPPLVVFASRLLRSKGIAEFIAMARRLKHARVQFAVIGAPDPESLDSVTAAELERWRKEGIVQFWGARTDMADIFRRAALCVLPTYYREGVPKVLIEASASGVPCITTDTAGCRDIVVHDETGLLVPPRDVDALTGAVTALMCDPDRRQAMGERACERFHSGFTLDHVVDATFETYDALLRVVAGKT